mmetsp:Transcript_6583/g.8894  ORF Transcript_6583/g.8894 Transcript_6583/m.8894 type:complete len:348 (-) Transcript_6583:1-1044(-)
MSRNKVAMAAAGGAYISAAYISYLYFTADKQKQQSSKISSDTKQGCSCCNKAAFSYVSDPNRTNTFQKIAYAYDDEISKDELVMGVNLLRRWMLYHHASGDVLEVGAGTGRNIDYYPNPTSVFQRLTWGQSGDGGGKISKIVLSDTSDKMLQQAKQKLPYKSSSQEQIFELKQADAANLHMYDDNSFDTIVDTFGLCSFDDPVLVLKELQRVCKKGSGKILLLEHGRSKTYEKLNHYLDVNAERHAKNWGCVWNRDIDDILEQAGLIVESLYTWHFGTTYYVVCRPGIAVRSDDDEGDNQKVYEEEKESAVEIALNDKEVVENKIHPVEEGRSWKRKVGGWFRKKDT